MARKRNYDILANAAALVGAMPSAQSASLVETDAAFAASRNSSVTTAAAMDATTAAPSGCTPRTALS